MEGKWVLGQGKVHGMSPSGWSGTLETLRTAGSVLQEVGSHMVFKEQSKAMRPVRERMD